MNFKAMNMFLSEENIKRHLEYLRTLRLRYSVLEKSLPELSGKNIIEIARLGISKKVKEEALELLWQIKSHELFFNSFCEAPSWPETIRRRNSSRERFAYDLLMDARGRDYGFLYVFSDRQEKLVTVYTDRFDGAFVKYEPRLCLDLYEHTYFTDYGFKKERFLRGALSYLDTGRLI